MDIRIENLSKRYGPQRAVDNISFEVKTGEILGFLGPNGAGKTTTMKMITGYLSVAEGDILIDGKSVREAGDEIKKHIGYLQENNPLYLDMPVIEYLQFCAALLICCFITNNFPIAIGIQDSRPPRMMVRFASFGQL